MYIDSLVKEIHLVGKRHNAKKTATSLYFGGGTPALAAGRLREIIGALKEHFIITQGIGVELHPDDAVPHVLKILKDAGVTKISIGIQSFGRKFQSVLGRKHINIATLKHALSEVPFETVSMDFIFALPNQTDGDLKEDIDTAFQNGANHVAIYPFIDFTFTPSTIHAMPKKEKRAMTEMNPSFRLERRYLNAKNRSKANVLVRAGINHIHCCFFTGQKTDTFRSRLVKRNAADGQLHLL